MEQHIRTEKRQSP